MKSSYSLDSGPVRRFSSSGEIAMTPMIDVIFLLLVFFIATSSFRIVEKLLPSSVSEQSPASGDQSIPPPEQLQELLEQVVVKLRQGDSGMIVELNGQPLENFESLELRLRSIAQLQSNLPVIISPDPTVTADRVVKSYDWARVAGLSRIYLAISQSHD